MNSIFIPGWPKRWIAPVSFLAAIFIGLAIGIPRSGLCQETHSRAESRRVQEPPEFFQELLEYLGQWETDDGSWIDPSDLDWLLQPDQEIRDDEGS